MANVGGGGRDSLVHSKKRRTTSTPCKNGHIMHYGHERGGEARTGDNQSKTMTAKGCFQSTNWCICPGGVPRGKEKSGHGSWLCLQPAWASHPQRAGNGIGPRGKSPHEMDAPRTGEEKPHPATRLDLRGGSFKSKPALQLLIHS